jgi:hypothetical protein
MDARDESDYGKFEWIRRPKGNKIEFWEEPIPLNPL